jgi:uncharacterized protein (TIGR03435 family)
MREQSRWSYAKRLDGKLRQHRIPLRASAIALLLALCPCARLTAQGLPSRTLAAQSSAEPQSQVAAGGKQEFDVASVKQNKTGSKPYSNFPLDSGNVYSTLNKNDAHSPAGGYFTATNQPLWRYIVFAYKLTGTQELALRFSYFAGLSSKVPAWVSGGFDIQAEAFDIEARAEGNPTKDQMRLMIQSLLADRFKLVVHMETRQAPVFALVLARPGKTGPRLQHHPASESCSTEPSTEMDSTPVPIPPHLPDATAELPIVCGVIAHLPPNGPGHYRIGGRNVTLGLLANSLPTQTGMATLPRPVIDQTGLSGSFNFSLEWLHEIDDVALQPGESGPLFREALKQQLGLDLKSMTGPIDVLIIDHVEHPSAN